MRKWIDLLDKRIENVTLLDRLRSQLADVEIETDEDVALLYELLEVAKFAILSKRYPFQNFPDELDDRYLTLQVRIAVYLYNKIGAEGQISHSENSISRTYEPGDIPESLLRHVTPLVGVPR